MSSKDPLLILLKLEREGRREISPHFVLQRILQNLIFHVKSNDEKKSFNSLQTNKLKIITFPLLNESSSPSSSTSYLFNGVKQQHCTLQELNISDSLRSTLAVLLRCFLSWALPCPWSVVIRQRRLTLSSQVFLFPLFLPSTSCLLDLRPLCLSHSLFVLFLSSSSLSLISCCFLLPTTTAKLAHTDLCSPNKIEIEFMQETLLCPLLSGWFSVLTNYCAYHISLKQVKSPTSGV